MMHTGPLSQAELCLEAAFPAKCRGYRNLYRLTETRSGFLNHCHIFEKISDGKRWVVRGPKSEEDRAEARKLIEGDFKNSGAFAAGLTFHLRTVSEQASFIEECRAKGLSVVPNFSRDERYLVLPYVHGRSLNGFVATSLLPGHLAAIRGVFQHLHRAHEAGTIFGDRWGPNTFIDRRGRPLEIDFDIEIKGPKEIAAAFEMAQAQYHLIHFAGANRSSLVRYMASEINRELVRDKQQEVFVKGFILGFTNFYRALFETSGTLLEGIEPPSTHELKALLP